jgi:hypothetical protein
MPPILKFFMLGGAMQHIFHLLKGGCSKQEKEFLWRSIIEEQEKSGMKKTKFCRYHQISPSIFKYWKKKFKTSWVTNKNEDNDAENKFIPIQVLRETPNKPNTEIRINFKNGYSIELLQGVSQDTLNVLINQMSQLPC